MSAQSSSDVKVKIELESKEKEIEPPQKKSRRAAKGHVENANYVIRWTMEQNLGDGEDENGMDIYVNHYKGTLIQNYESNESGSDDGKIIDEEGRIERVAGYITCWKINRHNIGNCGLGSFFEVLDPITEELSDVGILLDSLENSDDKDNFINEVGDSCEIIQGAVVYVDKIIVYKEYRGFGLGLFLLDSVVKVINEHMSLTLINPFPLQYEDITIQDDESRPHEYPDKGTSLKADKQKISNYYRKLGFNRIGANMMGVWNGYITPKLLSAAPKLKDLNKFLH